MKRSRITLCLLIGVAAVTVVWTGSASVPTRPAHGGVPRGSFAGQVVQEATQRVDRPILANMGNFDSRARFWARDRNVSLFFTTTGITIAASSRNTGYAVTSELVGARPVEPEPIDPLKATTRWFGPGRSGDPIPASRQLRYRSAWPGVDVLYELRKDAVDYTLVVAPGADVTAIRLAYRGGNAPAIQTDGSLRIETPAGPLTEGAPVATQNGSPIACAFIVHDDGTYGFSLGAHSPDAVVIIDPPITYASYLGTGNGSPFGSGSVEHAGDVTIDAAGNVYVTGYTYSEFPVTPGAYDTVKNGFSNDAFVSKLSADGSTLLWSTLLGGSSMDEGRAIAVDTAGNVYVGGITTSADFPVTAGAVDSTLANPARDIFVAKISPGGDALVWATYLGGVGEDWCDDMAIDVAGNVYISGGLVPGLATPGTISPGGSGGFVAKFPPTGAPLTYLTYFANSAARTRAIAVDSMGAVYGVGESGQFPVTPGAFQVTPSSLDASVFKMNPDAASLAWASYYGGSGTEFGYGIAVNPSGDVFITGYTNGAVPPTTPGAFDTTANGNADAFIARFSAGGASLAYASLLGGSGHDFGRSVAIDSMNNALVIVETQSANFPTTAGSFDPSFNQGTSDAALAKVDASGSFLLWSTYLGGGGVENELKCVAGPGDSVVVAGTTALLGSIFPTTSGSHQPLHSGLEDPFVTKLSSVGSMNWSTFLGGGSGDNPTAIHVDGAGATYIVGVTDSQTFPTTPGAYDATDNGGVDLFVTKLAPGGSSIEWSTYVGGNGDDYGGVVHVGSSGEFHVLGTTNSPDFPGTAGSYQAAWSGGVDSVLFRISAGGVLEWATYLGGPADDWGTAITVNGAGDIVVAGTTAGNFPTTAGAFDTTTNGSRDMYVAKIAAGGTALLWSTYLGSAGRDESSAVAIDSTGYVYVAGYTDSSAFPTTPGAYKTTYSGSLDTVIAKIAAGGGSLVWSTYFGSPGLDGPYSIDVYANGDVLVSGLTPSASFPTTPGAYDTSFNGAPYDATLTRMAANGASLVWSTFIGGAGNDYCVAKLAANGDILLFGATDSVDFPLAPAPAGNLQALYARMSPDGSTLLEATTLGGSDRDVATAVAIDAFGGVWLTGNTTSTDFPVTASAYDPTYGGAYDVFIVRLGASITNVTSPNPDGFYTAGQVIDIAVTFTQQVTVAGTPQLTLETGTSDAIASYVSGSGTNTITFSFTIAANHLTADLDYAGVNALVLNGGSITAADGYPAGLSLRPPGAPGSLSANKTIGFGNFPPVVTSVTSPTPNGTYFAGQTVLVEVLFNKPVLVSGTPQLTLETGITDAVVSYTAGSGSATLTFTYVVAPGHQSADLDVASAGALSLNGGSIQDAAGADATLTLPAPGSVGSLSANKSIVISNNIGVTSVSSPTPDGTYVAGQSIQVSVTFSGPVTVSGTPTLTLETGAANAAVPYLSGSGTTTLLFNYVVALGHVSSDLDVVSTTSLSGTLSGTGPVNLTLPPPGSANSLSANKNLVVDGTFATVVSVSSPVNGTFVAGQTIPINVTFSGPVTVTTAPTLTLNSGGTAMYASGSGSTTIAMTYTVLAGHQALDLEYTSTSALTGSFTSANGNPASKTLPTPGFAGSLSSNNNILVDAVPPVVNQVSGVSGTFELGAIVTVNAVFSQTVFVTGTPTLVLETGATDAVATYSGGTGTTLLSFTFTVALGMAAADLDYTSTGALSLNGGTIVDSAGNAAVLTLPAPGATGSLSATSNIVIDGGAPSPLAVTGTSGAYAAGTTVTLHVTFSKPVVVTGTPTLEVETGITDAQATYTSGSGSPTLAFAFTVAAGMNASDLDYTSASALQLNGGSIKDPFGNPAVLTLPPPGATGSLAATSNVVIDTIAPTILGAFGFDGIYGVGDAVTVYVAFSEFTFISPELTLTLETGTLDAVGVYAGGGGGDPIFFQFTVVVGNTSPDLDYQSTTALLLNGGYITDAAGNPAILTLPTPGGPGSLSANSNVVITAEPHPVLPTVGQYKTDGVTSIAPVNGTTDETAVVFRARPTHAELGRLIKVQIDINSTMYESAWVRSGQEARITAAWIPGGTYQWYARAVSDSGLAGPWTDFGCSITIGGYPYGSPKLPAKPRQLRGDGGTPLAIGASSVDARLAFSAESSGTYNDRLRLEIEVRPIGIPFSDEPTHTGDFGSGEVRVDATLPDGLYHWQFRAADAAQAVTAWTPFGGNPEEDADFAVDTSMNTAPAAPTGLSQHSSFGGSSISLGGADDDGALFLRAQITDPQTLQTMRLEVEVRLTAVAFTGTPTGESHFYSNGYFATVTHTPLMPGSYHWQARTVDSSGAASAWVSFGTGTSFTVGSNGAPFLVASTMKQYLSAGVTVLATAGTVVDGGVVLAAKGIDPDGGPVRLQIELRPFDSAESDAFTAESAEAPSGTTFKILVVGLPDIQWEWRARIVDSAGSASPWMAFDDDLDDVDFDSNQGLNNTPQIDTLKQLRVTTNSIIPVGGSTNEASVTFRATLDAGDTGTLVRMIVEVKPVGVPFDEVFSGVSDWVKSGTIANVTIAGLEDGVAYHWQVRSQDLLTYLSDWAFYGGNLDPDDADFTKVPNTAPEAPTNLGQYNPSAGLIPVGMTSSSGAITFKAKATDADGDGRRLEVEVQPVGIDFTGVPSATSGMFTGTQFGEVTIEGFAADPAAWHWQVRAIDMSGAASAWVSFGGNAESSQDFKIVNPTILLGHVAEESGVTTEATSRCGSIGLDLLLPLAALLLWRRRRS